MQRIIVLIGLLICSGCGDFTTATTPGKPVPVVAKDTVFSNIADAIDTGLIDNSTNLELVISHLRELNKLTDAQVEACYKSLPGIDKKERAITKADGDLIRGL
jgi:hypothetical protein